MKVWYWPTAPMICFAASGLTLPAAGTFVFTSVRYSELALASAQDFVFCSDVADEESSLNAETPSRNFALSLGLISSDACRSATACFRSASLFDAFPFL